VNSNPFDVPISPSTSWEDESLQRFYGLFRWRIFSSLGKAREVNDNGVKPGFGSLTLRKRVGVIRR